MCGCCLPRKSFTRADFFLHQFYKFICREENVKEMRKVRNCLDEKLCVFFMYLFYIQEFWKIYETFGFLLFARFLFIIFYSRNAILRKFTSSCFLESR